MAIAACRGWKKTAARRTLVDNYEGKRLNSPNDLTFHSNGDLYFTDPPYGLPKHLDDPRCELGFCGVYRLKPDGKLTLLTKDVSRPNGIGLSPDEKTLYVAVSDPKNAVWMAFDLKADGTLGKGRVLFDANHLGQGKAARPARRLRPGSARQPVGHRAGGRARHLAGRQTAGIFGRGRSLLELRLGERRQHAVHHGRFVFVPRENLDEGEGLVSLAGRARGITLIFVPGAGDRFASVLFGPSFNRRILPPLATRSAADKRGPPVL